MSDLRTFKTFPRIKTFEDLARDGDLQRILAEWAKTAGVLGANHLAKVRDELIELEAMPDDPMEMADVLLALMLHAEQRGVDLLPVAAEKLEVVRTRTYGKPDERGVVRHVPQQD